MSEHQAATGIEALMRQVHQETLVRLDGGALVAVKSVPKAKAMAFAGRLENLEGSGDVFDIATGMIQAAVALPGISDDDAFALFASSGGFTGELFRTVAQRCGVGELVELLAAEFTPADPGNRRAPDPSE